MRRVALIGMATGTVAIAIVSGGLLLGGRGEPRRSPADLGLGFRGRLLMGIDARFDGQPAHGAPILLDGPVVKTTRLSVQTATDGPPCSPAQQRSGFVCPASKDVKLRFKASALLDFRDPVPLNGRSFVLLSRRGLGVRNDDLAVNLPRLARGRHCLLVGVIQDAGDASAGRVRQYKTIAGYILDVQSAQPDHCVAAPVGASYQRYPLREQVGCGEGVLSARPDRVQLQRRLRFGDPLYAYAPRCDSPTTLVFTYDGLLSGRNGPVAPVSIGQANDALIRLPVLVPGFHSQAIVQRTANGGLVAIAGEPVHIGATSTRRSTHAGR